MSHTEAQRHEGYLTEKTTEIIFLKSLRLCVFV